MLYALRNFAHYRRTFYVGLVAASGYLGLLTQLQSIRNQEQIVKSLRAEQSSNTRRSTRAASRRCSNSSRSRSQYQQIAGDPAPSEANLQTQLDPFKIQLGLPPELEVRLDDTMLQQFQLNDPKLDDAAGRERRRCT